MSIRIFDRNALGYQYHQNDNYSCLSIALATVLERLGPSVIDMCWFEKFIETAVVTGTQLKSIICFLLSKYPQLGLAILRAEQLVHPTNISLHKKLTKKGLSNETHCEIIGNLGGYHAVVVDNIDIQGQEMDVIYADSSRDCIDHCDISRFHYFFYIYDNDYFPNFEFFG